jgi:hypothetical protein
MPLDFAQMQWCMRSHWGEVASLWQVQMRSWNNHRALQSMLELLRLPSWSWNHLMIIMPHSVTFFSHSHSDKVWEKWFNNRRNCWNHFCASLDTKKYLCVLEKVLLCPCVLRTIACSLTLSLCWRVPHMHVWLSIICTCTYYDTNVCMHTLHAHTHLHTRPASDALRPQTHTHTHIYI